MFCHTSVQTICHCIESMFGPYWNTIIKNPSGFFMRRINTPSGLFMRRCSHCGLKLQLLPLHTLILISLHLSRSGCKNKTLFDILACLLYLLSYEASPTLTANISLQALLGNEEIDECNYQELDPAELAEKVSTSLKTMLSQKLNIGWQVICNVIRRSQAE